MTNKSMFQHVSYTSVANISHALAQWVLLIIVVKLFDEIILGQLVLTLSIVSPVFMLFSIKLRTLVVTDYQNKRQFEQYLHARLTIYIPILLIIGAVHYFALNHIILSILTSVTLFKLSDGISELCYSYLHKHHLFNKASKSQFLRSLISSLTIAISAYLSQDVKITFFTWSSIAIVFALYDIYQCKSAIKSIENRPFAFTLLAFNRDNITQSLILYKNYWVLGLSIALGAMFVYIPNYMIEYFHTTTMVGEFAAISYFLVAGSILITSLSQAATPKLTALYNQQKHTLFIKLTGQLVFTGLAIGLIGYAIALLIGEPLLALIYNGTIAQLSFELQLIIVASTIRYCYIFLGSALNAMNCLKQQTFVYLVGAITLLVSSYFLIPDYSTVGAGVAMIIATFSELLIMIALFVRNWKIKPMESSVNA